MRIAYPILALSFSLGLMIPLSPCAKPFHPVEALPRSPELTDPFVAFDGTAIETPEQWRTRRRPELIALFQHYMYGVMPEPPGITAREAAPPASILNGRARLKQIEIRFNGLSENAPAIHLALFLPARRDAPAPVFLAINKCGNHTVVADEAVIIDEAAWDHSGCTTPKEDARGIMAEAWSVDYLTSRGYGFATFHGGDVDPDRDDFTDGIHPYYPDLPAPPEARWGTISAWAWGLMRAVDYLVTDGDVDPVRIAVIGHSRRGKTALFAGALDERIALVVPHQSGTGGAALSRANDQETVERINRVFPHWFNDNFVKFNGREELLPFDQHLLMALVAPRPLLDTAGLRDTWANYESALRALKAADAVYKFLGAEGIKGEGVISGEAPISAENTGTLLQYRRDTAHVLDRGYWRAILDFADARAGLK